MAIIINPRNKEEETALLRFLQKMKYDYTIEDDETILSEEQQREISERDRLYESGKMESYSLQELKDHFNILKK